MSLVTDSKTLALVTPSTDDSKTIYIVDSRKVPFHPWPISLSVHTYAVQSPCLIPDVFERADESM